MAMLSVFLSLKFALISLIDFERYCTTEPGQVASQKHYDVLPIVLITLYVGQVRKTTNYTSHAYFS